MLSREGQATLMDAQTAEHRRRTARLEFAERLLDKPLTIKALAPHYKRTPETVARAISRHDKRFRLIRRDEWGELSAEPGDTHYYFFEQFHELVTELRLFREDE